MDASILFQLAVSAAREAGPQGFFELRFKKFHRPAANAEDKDCTADLAAENGNQCQTRVRVCLKHYMAQVESGSCTFGMQELNATGRYNDTVLHLPPVRFAIDFKWPVGLNKNSRIFCCCCCCCCPQLLNNNLQSATVSVSLHKLSTCLVKDVFFGW